MKNTIKHIIYDSLSGIMCLLSIIIGIGLPMPLGEIYKDTGDTKCIAYAILSIAVSIIIFHIGIKLSIHKTKEDKQELHAKLAYEPNSELMQLIETGNIEAIKEKYEVKQYDL